MIQYPANGILRMVLPMYTEQDHAHGHNEAGDVSGMRRVVRSQGIPLSRLRSCAESQGAMGPAGNTRAYGSGDPIGWQETAQDLRRSFMGFKVAISQVGRSIQHSLLGRRSKAAHLPLPVGVDYDLWADSAGTSCSPHQRRQNRRPTRELATQSIIGTCRSPYVHRPVQSHGQSAGTRTAAHSDIDVRTMRQRVQEPRTGDIESLLFAQMLCCHPPDNAHLCRLWAGVHRWLRPRQAASVLQPRVFPSELREETRCIGGRDVTMAYWQTEGDGKVCDGCRRRGAEYPYPGVVVA
jgi:hypothetical protein